MRGLAIHSSRMFTNHPSPLFKLVSEAAPAEQADALVMAKELAHRLALTYGVDARKHREGLVRLHRFDQGRGSFVFFLSCSPSLN